MSKYYCNRCGYSTNQITHFKNHLKRKKICKPTLEDISIEQICFIYNFDITSFQQLSTAFEQEKPAFQQVSTAFEQVKPAFTNSTGNICEFCKKSFNRKYGLNCHLKICKIKKENDIKKEKDNQQLCLLETELKEVKEELSKTKQIITNNNINKTTNNNSHNTINNTININNFGEENIKHIDYSYYNNILKGIYGAVPKLVEKIHFDKEHPENQNIKLTNKKEPYIKIRKNNKWKLADRKTEVLDLIDSKCFLLSEKYKKLLKRTQFNT